MDSQRLRRVLKLAAAALAGIATGFLLGRRKDPLRVRKAMAGPLRNSDDGSLQEVPQKRRRSSLHVPCFDSDKEQDCEEEASSDGLLLPWPKKGKKKEGGEGKKKEACAVLTTAPALPSPPVQAVPKPGDEKKYFSYADIHELVGKMAAQVKEFEADCLIAIGGGGFIPGRILRTMVKLPLYTVSAEHYDEQDGTNEHVEKIQWISEDLIRGKRICIVDEVDDTRKTLAFVSKLLLEMGPAAVSVAVVHNKLKEKRAELPEGVGKYICGAEIPDDWIAYPWDAEKYGHGIRHHEALSSIRV